MPILPLAALAFLAIDPKASRTDTSGAVSVEVRGGRAPVTPADDPTPAFLWIVTPRADVNYRTRQVGEFSLGYSPTVQYRAPNRLDLNRPLLMHQAYAGYQDEVNARWTVGVNLGATFGETGYNGVVTALGDQAQTPDVEVLKFAVVSGGVTLGARLTPRHTLSIEPQANYRSAVQAGENATVPPQTVGTLGVMLTHRVTPVDDLEYALRPGVVDYDSRSTFANLDGRVAWSHRLRPSLMSRIDGGVFAVAPIRGSEQGFQIFPVGGVSIEGALRRRSSHQIDGNIGIGVLGFFDRITEEVEPRARLSGGLTVTVPPRWIARAVLSGYTAMTSEPRVAPGGTFEVPQSQIQFTTPVTYLINDRQEFEFGTVMSVRGSHVRSENFEFTQLETWLYVAYRIGGGTARGGEEATGRTSGSVVGRGTRGTSARSGRQ